MFEGIRAVIFDLDGTLVDSKDDLATAANLTLAGLGLPPLPPPEIYPFIGNGTKVLVTRTLASARRVPVEAITPEEAEAALAVFRRHYREHCLDQTRLYPGVVPTLRALRDRGLRIAVVTNKDSDLSRTILSGLGILECIELLLGPDSVTHRKPHPEPVLRVLEHFGVRPQEAILVGDSPVDAETARAAGVRLCAVTYGYGLDDPAQLRRFGPSAVIDSMEKLPALIL